MKHTAGMTTKGRKCALCGTGQTPRKGGLAGYAMLISWAREKGVSLKLPESRYMHIPCANRVLK